MKKFKAMLQPAIIIIILLINNTEAEKLRVRCNTELQRHSPTLCEINNADIKENTDIEIVDWDHGSFLKVNFRDCNMEVVPKSIQKYLDVEQLLFTSKNLKSFDNVNVPSCSLSAFVVVDSHISELKNDVFSKCSSLSIITFSGSLIKSIESKAFRGLTFLKRISITDSNVETFPESVFNDLTNLEVADLKQNSIKTIDSKLFANNLKLHSIFLSNNQITEILEGTFDGLTLNILDLSHNKLVKICPLTAATVMIGNNYIKEVFIKRNVRILMATKNPVENIDCDAGKLKITGLYISNSFLPTINCLNQMNGIQSLSIIDNSMVNVSDVIIDIYREISKLNQLHVDRISNFDDIKIKFPNLNLLQLHEKYYNQNEIVSIKQMKINQLALQFLR
jgi:Leucine-rich repeat (LRR) protein